MPVGGSMTTDLFQEIRPTGLRIYLAPEAHLGRGRTPHISIRTYVNGSYGYLDNIWNANPGDLLYVDWEGDEEINHVIMVVTGTTPEGVPSITQKSTNRSNISLHHLIWLAEQEGMDANDFIWYGLQRQQQ